MPCWSDTLTTLRLGIELTSPLLTLLLKPSPAAGQQQAPSTRSPFGLPAAQAGAQPPRHLAASQPQQAPGAAGNTSSTGAGGRARAGQARGRMGGAAQAVAGSDTGTPAALYHTPVEASQLDGLHADALDVVRRTYSWLPGMRALTSAELALSVLPLSLLPPGLTSLTLTRTVRVIQDWGEGGGLHAGGCAPGHVPHAQCAVPAAAATTTAATATAPDQAATAAAAPTVPAPSHVPGQGEPQKGEADHMGSGSGSAADKGGTAQQSARKRGTNVCGSGSPAAKRGPGAASQAAAAAATSDDGGGGIQVGAGAATGALQSPGQCRLAMQIQPVCGGCEPRPDGIEAAGPHQGPSAQDIAVSGVTPTGAASAAKASLQAAPVTVPAGLPKLQSLTLHCVRGPTPAARRDPLGRSPLRCLLPLLQVRGLRCGVLMCCIA